MVEERFAEEQIAVLDPMVDKLLTMMGAARDAFNRHSRASLLELLSLQGVVAQDFGDVAKQLRSLSARKSEGERLVLTRFQSIVDHLAIIGDNIGRCAEPIKQKIKGAVLFSEKAVTQANFLFDQHSGMIRSLLDIIKTDNDFLKKYLLEEGRKLGKAALSYATEHEDRMIEGLCLPEAAPIFLALMDRMSTIAQHEVEIATLLARRP
jgi:Na+/phosphate symporter